MSDLSYSNFVVAVLRPGHFNAIRGLGFCRFQFGVAGQWNRWPPESRAIPAPSNQPLRMAGWEAEVSIHGATSNMLLGRARPQRRRALALHAGYEITLSESFELDVPLAHLALLDQARGGGSLTLCLTVFAEFESDGQSQSANAVVEYRVDPARWSEVLDSVSDDSFIPIEIGLLGTHSGRALPEALERLLEAQRSFMRGEWTQVVAACRVALDAMIEFRDLESRLSPLRQQYSHSNERKSLGRRDRFLLIVDTVRNYSHLAHHTRRGEDDVFGRDDAALILACTAYCANCLSSSEWSDEGLEV